MWDLLGTAIGRYQLIGGEAIVKLNDVDVGRLQTGFPEQLLGDVCSHVVADHLHHARLLVERRREVGAPLHAHDLDGLIAEDELFTHFCRFVF